MPLTQLRRARCRRPEHSGCNPVRLLQPTLLAASHRSAFKGRTALVAVALLFATVSPAAHDPLWLRSPDQRVEVAISVEAAFAPLAPHYAVSFNGREVLWPSRLGFELAGVPLGTLDLAGTQRRSSDTTWRPVYGERAEVRDHFNELTLDLRETTAPHRQLQVVFRAYDEGVAFRTTFLAPEGGGTIRIARERSEFRFSADHPAWAVYSAQGNYAKAALSQIKRGCERPLTIQAGPDLYLAVGEAALVDYARMKLAPLDGVPHALVSDLGSEVVSDLPLTTPWRVLMIGRSPGELIENNHLFLNLNEPCAIADTSWIKPGKVIREVTLTTQGGLACVDFAAKHGLQYVEYDAGWYGPEGSEDSDATSVTLDPKRSKGPLDLPRVIQYARERDIGILLYVNRRALEQQLDEILPLYRSWGVAGVKYGFVNVGSQRWTSWLHAAVRKAAEHHLMVDVHDEYRPTGWSRTYPNLMTQEGIAGDETRPVNSLTLTILFTRMLAGAADNTICYYDDRVAQNASHAYQLAKAVCLYSPWQFVYWYDRPPGSPGHIGGAGGAQTGIGDEPELEFFDAVPTVWDDTRVIHGRIGEYAVIARRSGGEWFIGGMNSGEARSLEVPLDFLPPARTHEARIYSDDPAVPTRTHVRIDRRRVTSETVLVMEMSAQGGQAVRLIPAEK